MRSLRLGAAMLALLLLAAACGDESEEPDEESAEQSSTTTLSVITTTSAPVVTSPTTSSSTTAPPQTGDAPDPLSATTLPPGTTSPGSAPPEPPGNVKCVGGSSAGELLVEWDAPSSPPEQSKIRVYVSEDGGPFINNGEFTIDQLDTARGGGTRWAAPARGLPANVSLRLTATSFNLLGQESGWYITEGLYTGPGQPCGAALPPTTCTAGCDEAEGEPAP